MLKKLMMVVALSSLTAAAFAHHAANSEATQVINLKDGSTLYVFKDGNTAVEDKYGRATRMAKDAVVETTDGQMIATRRDNVARLDSLLRKGHEDRY